MVLNKVGSSVVYCLMMCFLLSCDADKLMQDGEVSTLDSELENLVMKYEKGDITALNNIAKIVNRNDSEEEYAQFTKSFLFFVDQRIIQEDYQLSLDLLRFGKKLVEKSEKKLLAAEFDLQLSWVFYNLQNLDSSTHYMALAEQVPFNEFNNNDKCAYYNTKGLLAENSEKYLEAIDYFKRALEYFEGQGGVNEGSILQNVGSLYLSLNNYNRALDYLLQSKEIFEKQSDQSRTSMFYTNLGVVYMRLDSLDQAEMYHKKTLALSPAGSIQKARSLTNYANVLRRKGQLETAMIYLDSSTAICRKNDIEFGVVINNINYSNVLIDKNAPEKALHLLNSIDQHPIVRNSTKLTLEVLDLKRQAYYKMGDITQAYKQQELYHDLQNQIIKEGEANIVLEWEESFKRIKSEKELVATKESLNEAQWQKKLFLTVSFLLLMLFISIGLIIYQRRQKLAIQSKLLEEERENLKLQFEVKERELASQSMHLQAIGGFAEGISDKLSELQEKMQGDQAEDLQRIIREFENGLPDELWDDFRIRFENINNNFYQQLIQIAPDLTPVEIKIASFLRLNLSSKEISRLTNRSPRTIANTRSTLRKKLHLEDDDNLTGFLLAL